MKKTTILLSGIAILTACTPTTQKVEPIPTIDSTLQVKVDSILLEKLVEIDALKGQAIVMEVQSGKIKAMMGMEKKEGSTHYVPCEYGAQPSGLVRAASVLAAMETGKVLLSDTVDVGEGVYLVNGGELKDHNWRKGGYGKLTLQEGLMYNSNIAVYKAMEKAFGENAPGFFDALKKMDFEHPEDSSLEQRCLIQKVTPLQTLTFYNAIANSGKMVQFQDSTIVMNPQIAGQAHVDSMKVALEQTVINGLGKRAQSEKVNVAGLTASAPISEPEDESLLYENTEFASEFCGYFPAENPQYSMIVTINKKGLPASGGLMAAPVFKQIAEYMVESEDILPKESLNGIRFKNWTEKEWLDNEYIRAVRQFLDDYIQGKVEDSGLDPYKETLKSKFIIANIEPALFGGAYIQIIFLDLPNRAFTAWVYSDVDEEERTVSNYQLRTIAIEETILNITKEELLQDLKEHPELKLW